MSIRELAEKIPAEYRKEILELNMIESAVAISGNTDMHYLGVIWKQYIDQNWDPHCALCYSTVLKGFKQMLPIFVEIEKEGNLLDGA